MTKKKETIEKKVVEKESKMPEIKGKKAVEIIKESETAIEYKMEDGTAEWLDK